MQNPIHYLRQTVAQHHGAGLTDARLLEDFVTGRDKAAFTTLVHRHGPMVLAVVRRVVGNVQDAEEETGPTADTARAGAVSGGVGCQFGSNGPRPARQFAADQDYSIGRPDGFGRGRIIDCFRTSYFLDKRSGESHVFQQIEGLRVAVAGTRVDCRGAGGNSFGSAGVAGIRFHSASNCDAQSRDPTSARGRQPNEE